jgi:hypothetical protein
LKCAATVEDVRDALAKVTVGLAETSARQYILRAKSLLGYAHLKPAGDAPSTKARQASNSGFQVSSIRTASWK